jgi:hypothetical protein
MSSFFDEASLVMIPSGYKDQKVYSVKPLDGSGDLTFSRASSATRVASNGLIEKVRTNLALYSNTFTNAAWVKDGCTITANYGTAPDGTQTASRAVFSGGDKTLYQLISATGVAGSLYVKGTAGQTIAFGIAGSESIFTLDGTWQRFTKSIAGATTSIQLNTYGGVTARDVLIWSAQLEYGDIATDPIVTTSAAVSVGPVSGLPRLDYLNSTCPRLLLEPQRTNLVQYSEQLNNAYWQKESAGTGTAPVVTANAAVSPDGSMNADVVVFNIGAGTSSSDLSQLASGSFSLAAASYATSVYLKTTDGTTKQMSLTSPSGIFTSITVTADWQRFNIITTGALAGELRIRLRGNESTSSSASVAIWGAQLEAGAYATSYIPTLGTSVTRVADAASKTGISSLIGSTAGSVFFEGVYDSVNTVNTRFFSLKGAGTTYQNLMIFQDNQDGTFNIQFVDSSVTSIVNITWTHGLTNGQSFKVAVAYASNDVIVYQNGVSKGTDTSYTPITFSDLYLQYTDVFGKTQTKQTILFPTRLSNSDLAALTA